MRFPWQGPAPHGASAPSAGVCHRCELPAQGTAPRSVAERRPRSGEDAPWHAPKLRTLARSRGPARWDGGKRRRSASRATTYPAILCDYGHAYPTASAYGTGSGDPCLIPSRFSPTVGIATKSPL